MRHIRFLALAVSLFAITHGVIHASPTSGTIVVNPNDIVTSNFLGFGAEWDTYGYDQAGITEQDFALIRQRVEWMHLPISRIMMQCKYCYKGDGKYDMNSPSMKALCRNLDVCQQLGTTVFLTDWGIEKTWEAILGVTKVDDPKYAEIIGTYMDYLIKTRGYTCIKYFIMVNEPNLEIVDWNRWKQGVMNVSAELKKRGLDKMVQLAGSDESDNEKWHLMAVDQLKNVLGAYDVHRYVETPLIKSGSVYDWFKSLREYALKNDPGAKNKPIIVGEAGPRTSGSGAAGNPLNLEYANGVLMADYAAQAANAGAAAVSAWMLDDNSHNDFNWGMWKSKAKGMGLKPWFYTWSLLCRYFPSGSQILTTPIISPDARILVAHKKKAWTFCIVNESTKPLTLHLSVSKGPSSVTFRRYAYTPSSAKSDAHGFPVPQDKVTWNLSQGGEIVCEGNSVVLLTSMIDPAP